MKKKIIIAIVSVLIFLLPFALIAAAGFLLPPVYGGTFMGQLYPMCQRLENIASPKIVVIGGSSVPFGVNASLLSETVGMPVVNFGLYAALGTKAMLDLAEEEIDSGDIVIIAPEVNSETYSMFFGAEALWQGADGHASVLKNISSDGSELLGTFWSYAYSKIKYSGKDITPSGIYKNSSFDEYGYISQSRPYNIMNNMFDANMTVDFSTELFSRDFIDYVNDFTDEVTERGASVYFFFSPINEDALDASVTMDRLNEFIAFIEENVHAPLLSSPNDCIYRSGYFYDSNFHLNSAGAVLHTKTIADCLAKIIPGVTVDIEVPDMPEVPDEPTETPPEYDENEKYFVIESTPYGVAITGLSELGKAQSTLTTPVSYNGEFVKLIYTGAFDGCSGLSELYITKNIGQIMDNAFSDAPSLSKIHLLFDSPDDCTVNSMRDTLTGGLPGNVKFLVKSGLGNEFRANYFWGIYGDYIAEEN